MSDEDFNLDVLIDQVSFMVGPAPADIAKEVQGQIPKKCRDDIELKLLVGYIRGRKARLLPTVNAPERQATSTNPASSRKPNRSAKVAGFQRLGRILAVRVCVGASNWKTFGECSYSDLIYAANNRREHAAATLLSAAEFDAWAKLVKEHGAVKVSEIPDAVLINFAETRRAPTS